ncbi:PE-PPE domain-containing protein [Mycolicibacterium vaccae]|uniref:PE-PPE domain-containing protein n=1 Tax=Mycolicibacterium vaccae TaxID=1810 RepID=UPI003CE98C00
MKLVKKVAMALAAVPFLAGSLALGAAAPTQAATATLSGMFGSSPKYNGISTGGRSLCPCRPILYNSLPGLLPTASGVWALDQWVSATPGSKTVIAYSKGTHSALGWIRENAHESSAHTVRFILLAAPETPGNGGWRIGHNMGNGLPAGNFGNVSFVVRQYDKVADAPQDPFNFLAAINASMSTHLEGYDELDLDKPDAIYVDPKTGARTLYFRTDVLPLLSWTEWFATDEQIAQWDALLRPLIEAAYDRPVDIPGRGSAAPRADRTVTVPVVATPPVLDEEVGPAVSTDTDTGADSVAVSASRPEPDAWVTPDRTAVRHSARDVPEAAADVIDAPVTPAEPAVPAEDPAEDPVEDLGDLLAEEDSGHGADDPDPAPDSGVTAASEVDSGSTSRASGRDSGARERRAG